jgi:hypothetical protein
VGEGSRADHRLQLHAGFSAGDTKALENTRRFLERIAPLTDTFSTLGVAVPFPGTPLYDDFHQRYGFTAGGWKSATVTIAPCRR